MKEKLEERGFESPPICCKEKKLIRESEEERKRNTNTRKERIK